MPLSTLLPPIDNRRFDEIVAEARTRIPRYTPEWTDLNDSDPGITLVELFAWLTEMQLFRLSQVPELNYLKFLQLLGMELLPAEPATVEITFPALTPATAKSITIPKATQVSADGGESPAPIVFETDRALIAVTAELAAVQAFDGYTYADYTTTNTDAIDGFQPLGAVAPVDAALYIGFRVSAGLWPPKELDLALFVPQQGAVKAVTCGTLVKGTHALATLAWEYWDGALWRSLDLLADETGAFTRSGHVFIRMPDATAPMVALAVGAVAESLVYVRARVTRATYERVPRLLNVRTNTVPATQAVTVRDEVLGGSNGRKNQQFVLGHAPVLRDSLTLEVNEGDGPRPWSEVPDFFASGPRDMHYVLDRTTGTITFGDGSNGAIPVGNPQIPDANIVAVRYRYGGGASGNVAAGQVRSLLTSIGGIDDNTVGNLQAAVGGRDEETLDQAKLRVPHTVRSRCRAVTAEDFEQLAIEAGTIRRAKALPLAHPDFPGVQVPGVVTVIVVPDGDAPKPVPSEGTLRNVCEYLDQARLITTEVYVAPPSYRLVRVSADVTADDGADLAEVKRDIEQALLDYFHPLKGGEDGMGWPFGGDIYFSRVFGRVSVSGVRSIERLTISVDGEPTDPCTNIQVCDGVLLYSTEHDINVTYQPDA